MNTNTVTKFIKYDDHKNRILAFCWDNPLIEENYINLVNELSNALEIFPIFIVPTLLTKLRFLKRNLHSFTYKELIRYSLQLSDSEDHKYNNFDRRILKDLSDYDKFLGWSWVSNQNLNEDEFNDYQALTILKAYDFIFKKFRPHLAITWNGVALLQKALAFLARTYDVPVLFLERGLLPQTLYVDTEGVNYKSSIAGDKWFNNKIPYPDTQKINMTKNYCKKLKEEKRSVVDSGNQISVEEIKIRLGIGPSSKVILFPMQIELDSNILYFSPHYSKMIEIIKDIQQAISQFNDIHLIVKPHPEDRNRLDELQLLDNNTTHIPNNLNLYSLLELADLVITVNSTVGFEALILQKPVIVLGKAIYSEKGFTYDLQSQRELPNLIKRTLERHMFNKKEFYRFLDYILEHQHFQLNANQDYWKSRNMITKKIVELSKNQKRNGVSINKTLIDKLSGNIRLQKIFARGKTVILGPMDKKLETVLGKPAKEILSAKDAITFLFCNLFSKNKPNLVFTTKPLSLKRHILFKLIRSDVKALLTGTDLNFVKNLQG